MTRTNERRKTELAAIHAKRNRLGLDEETYRSLIRQVGGAASGSSADLDAAGRAKVLNHLSGLEGPRNRRRHPGAGRNNTAAQLGKIEALLTQMRAEWAYADGIARKMFRLDSVRFCNSEQLRAVIAALSKEQEKRSALAWIEELRQKAGISAEQLAQQVPGWERTKKGRAAALRYVAELAHGGA